MGSFHFWDEMNFSTPLPPRYVYQVTFVIVSWMCIISCAISLTLSLSHVTMNSFQQLKNIGILIFVIYNVGIVGRTTLAVTGAIRR